RGRREELTLRAAVLRRYRTTGVLGGRVRDTACMDARLEEIERRYEAVGREMASPGVSSDHERLRELGRAYAELAEIIGPYREYKQSRAQAVDARELATNEADPEMAAYFLEEAERAE